MKCSNAGVKIWAILVVLLLQRFPVSGATATWVAVSGTNDWFVGANWSGGSIPANGDDIVITNNNVGVLLTNSTASFPSVLLSNRCTLVFSNWNTTLSATNVYILTNSVVTHAGPYSNDVMSNAVWIVCSNMLVGYGGSINVNGKGYQGGRGQPTVPATYVSPSGPGAPPGGSGKGGGYGGKGGFNYSWGNFYETNTAYGQTYGSPDEPLAPGSGGAGYYSGGAPYWGANGGGAVRIQASGNVSVNGSITANGGNSYNSGAGSGGGIYVVCDTLSGTNGIIQARGGYNTWAGSYGGSSGGGGRIAVVYNPTNQGELPIPGITFSARPLDTSTYGNGDIGTLYFSDNLFLTSPIVHDGVWVVPGLTNWTTGSLFVSNAWFRFSGANFHLTVSNDLILSGTDNDYHKLQLPNGSSLSCGGNLEISSAQMDINRDLFQKGGSPAPFLNISGNLLLTNNAVFNICSAPTNDSGPDYGALAQCGGNVAIATGSWIYCYTASISNNGGASLFMMKNLSIAAGGGIYANALGYGGGNWDYTPGPGHGYGWTTNYGRYADGGGGHGGRGGHPNGGGSYGSSNAPILPGSGGGGNISGGTRFWGGVGGGVIRIRADNTVTLNGTLTANGSSLSGSYSLGGGGAGGSIYIACRRFAGSGGVLRANGGQGNGYSSNGGGGGGGGRIAVWRISDTSEGVSVAANGGPDEDGLYPGTNGSIVLGQLSTPGTMFMVY